MSAEDVNGVRTVLTLEQLMGALRRAFAGKCAPTVWVNTMQAADKGTLAEFALDLLCCEVTGDFSFICAHEDMPKISAALTDAAERPVVPPIQPSTETLTFERDHLRELLTETRAQLAEQKEALERKKRKIKRLRQKLKDAEWQGFTC